jgi:dGTPase
MNWSKLLCRKRLGEEDDYGSAAQRTEFERDFDRIVFSSPFRRLQDKTQVFPLPESDFVHTRLTHSLEVSCVGRSLGKLVGENVLKNYSDIDDSVSPYDFGSIVAAASLSHDIGNPPFGHSGEKAISDFFIYGKGKVYEEQMNNKQWNDLINFEGNAQGFRILTKSHYSRLKLTYASIAAFVKYPRESVIQDRDPQRKSQDKYSFFQSEKHIFSDVASEVGLIPLSNSGCLWCRHPLTFLVEAADDICYRIIDLEDACRLNLVSFNVTEKLLKEIAGANLDLNTYTGIDDENEKIGYLRARAINKLIYEAVGFFMQNKKEILNGTFDNALISGISSSSALDEIMVISEKKIYNSRSALETQMAGFEVLGGLLDYFITAVAGNVKKEQNRILLELIPKQFLYSKDNFYEKILSVIGFVAGMTDSYAISLYRKIKGISLPK